MTVRQIILAGTGFVFLVLGCIGIAVPVLPTVPFFLVTLVCFAKSSRRQNNTMNRTALSRT